MDNLVVRVAELSDSAAIASLMKELGYAVSPKLVQAKIAEYAANPSDLALVAEVSGEVLGCVTGHIISLFHQPGACGRVTSLVIASNSRGVGVGKFLIKAI